MATAKILETIIGLVIVIIVFIVIGGCITQILNPKCDLRASDAFDEFVELYEDCMNGNRNDICECRSFDITKLPPEHKIVLSPSIKKDADDEIIYEAVRVSLVCNERNAKNYYFGDYEKSEKIRVYFSDPTNFDEAKGYEDKYGGIVKEIKRGLHISDKLLGQGFEMDGTRGFPFCKGEGLLYLLGGSNDNILNLVNYEGEVAFVVKTVKQKEFLEENLLNPC